MKNYIIHTDGTIEPIVLRNPKEISLEEMQKAVGGYIERVGTYLDCSVWANEEGLLKGLPLNVRASELCYRPIVGDVLVVEEKLVK